LNVTISPITPSLRVLKFFAVSCAAVILSNLSMPALAQMEKPKPKLMNNGDVLSGELRMLKARGGKGKRVSMFQVESEPRRLNGPDGLCNLETGPETFQIVTHDDSEISRLKPFVGKTISIKVNDVSCATAAGQVSEALVSKWTIVTQ
jgi:hypothetical protein